VRVIAGELRSRRLVSAAGLDTRPTPDRLRESLFSILAPRLAGTAFVDLYAGTGAVGIEALSRGAARAIFVERGHAALDALRENIRTLGLAGRAEIRTGKVAAMLDRVIDPAVTHIVFLDPPYELEQEYDVVLEKLGDLLADRATAAVGDSGVDRSGIALRLIIAQHSTRLKLGDAYGPLRRTRILKQGDNALSFYEPHFAS
jgi:16S rRNA (guanine(966)-N(2))-methyltransferase RsmD